MEQNVNNFWAKKSSEETSAVDPANKELNVGKRIKQNLKNKEGAHKANNPYHDNLTVFTIEPLGRRNFDKKKSTRSISDI